MTTIFYRTERNGNLKRMTETEGTQKEIREELKANGFIVVALYKGDISYQEHDNMDITRTLNKL